MFNCYTKKFIKMNMAIYLKDFFIQLPNRSEDAKFQDYETFKIIHFIKRCYNSVFYQKML